MRTVALRLAYDGGDFVGSQWQTNGRSVQGELEGAWQQLTGMRERMTLAGRTDAGVHACGQVASIRSATRLSCHELVRGLNGILPDDVAIYEAWPVDEGFHARHTAIRRVYRYMVDAGVAPSPLLRRNALHISAPLDIEAMTGAAQGLLGMHDFAVFADSPAEGSTVRRIDRVSWSRDEWWNHSVVVFEIAANAFLRHMVRNIVGTLLLVGQHRIDAARFAALFAGQAPRHVVRLAPAHGLCLMMVEYPHGGRAAAEAPVAAREDTRGWE
jgi:tRNA pseudouridine38-40 synthase